MPTSVNLNTKPSQRAKKEFAVQLYWPDEDAGTPEDATESWYDAVPTSNIDFSGLGDMCVSLLQCTKRKLRWKQGTTNDEANTISLSDTMDDSGRGDRLLDRRIWAYRSHRRSGAPMVCEWKHPVAHFAGLLTNTPAQPGGTYGPAMALEDALVFGTLFSHLSSWDQVPTFLNAYQEIRQGRTTTVNGMDVSNAAFVRLPPGPARDARDAQIRQARDEWDDGSLKQEFEGLAQLFCYEAEDAAQVSCHHRSSRLVCANPCVGMVGNVGSLSRQRRELRCGN